MFSSSRSDTKTSWRITASEISHHYGVFIKAGMLSLVCTALSLATPLFFEIIIDSILVHNGKSTLIVMCMGMVVCVVFQVIMQSAQDAMLIHVNTKIDLMLGCKALSKLLSLPICFFDNREVGSLTRDVQQLEIIRDYLTGKVFFGATQLFALIVFLPWLIAYNSTLALLVMVFSGSVCIISLALSGAFQRRGFSLYAADSARQAALIETITGAATIKALGLEVVRSWDWQMKSAQALKASCEFQYLCIASRAVTGLIEQVMTVAVIGVGAFMVFRSEITVGQLVAFQMLSGRVTGPLINLVGVINGYQRAQIAAKQSNDIMEAETEPFFGSKRPSLHGHIVFDAVSFGYPGVNTLAVNELSFKITPGMVIGIVGRSGSGKSTLLRLMQGLLVPSAGTIQIDGVDLTDIDIRFLREQIGVVPQDSFLFNDTVAENVRAGCRDADRAAVEAACVEAGAAEFIRNLPDGYDTQVHEGGSNLSGGQRQRIAIARALVRQPKILVLDEATSALDLQTESLIQRNLQEVARDRTSIIVTHRLASLHIADAIIVMDEGRLVGFGSHEQLLNSCGAYTRLWASQEQAAYAIAAE